MVIGYSNKRELASFSQPAMCLLLYFQTSCRAPGHLNTKGAGLGAEQRWVPEHMDGKYGFAPGGPGSQALEECLRVCGVACLRGCCFTPPPPKTAEEGALLTKAPKDSKKKRCFEGKGTFQML